MLRPRIIPVLLVRNNGLVKTRNFGEDKYVGDPLNAVRIYNEKSVDELIVLDIDATTRNQPPDMQLIRKLANECRMPLCYGGGIKSIDQARQIIALGVEKIAISSAAIDNPQLIEGVAEAIGSQSIVVVLDVKKTFFGKYEIYTHNGTRKIKLKLPDVISEFHKRGVGEFVINSIDQDGVQGGYDLQLAKIVKDHVKTPFTILGGAGNLAHIGELIAKFGVLGCAAGSLFVFKGKYRAVLINYPDFSEKYAIILKNLSLSN